jgi:hypothetical protein
MFEKTGGERFFRVWPRSLALTRASAATAPALAAVLLSLLLRDTHMLAPPCPPSMAASARQGLPALASALVRRRRSSSTSPAATALDAAASAAASKLGDLRLGPSSLVLGIESSCDDTAAAVVRGDGTLLGQAIVTQVRGARRERMRSRPGRCPSP